MKLFLEIVALTVIILVFAATCSYVERHCGGWWGELTWLVMFAAYVLAYNRWYEPLWGPKR